MDEKVWRLYWRRAFRAAWWLRLVPFVRLVGLNGSMVTGGTTSTSDIDFYIVIKRGHIVTGRVLVTLLVQLLGLRRHGELIAGRVCLNRFASTDLMEITPANDYHARVFHNLIPLFAYPEIYNQYVDSNQWMLAYGYQVNPHGCYLRVGGISLLIQKLGELFLWPAGRLVEAWLFRWQKNRVQADPRTHLKGSIVVVSEQELRFHLKKEVHG